jgi:serine/threonine protein kinase
MGVVYEALDGERNARVALKTLRDFEASSLLRFKHEFRSLQDLVHPNLIALHELFQENGQWFFTMELVSGVDFLGYVRSPGRDGVPKNPFDRDDLRVNPDDETMIDWSRPSLSDIAPPSSKPGQGFDEPRLRACWHSSRMVCFTSTRRTRCTATSSRPTCSSPEKDGS